MENVKKQVHAHKVYEAGYSGKGVCIALLDSGVAPHIQLRDKIVFFRDYVNERLVAYDDNGHGTHIAGILGGRDCGMAPGIHLVVFKILDHKGSGRTMDAIHALEWICEHQQEYNIRILNFSMGYLPNASQKLQQELLSMLEKLWDMGVIVVTAAGNNGPGENTITVPGISRKVITVGMQEDGFASRGPTGCCIVKPEILAPGQNVRSLSHIGNGYAYKSGTSMATPVVSGALALALECRRSIQPVEMKLLLYDTVRPMTDFGKKSSSWGLLDVDNLMKML